MTDWLSVCLLALMCSQEVLFIPLTWLHRQVTKKEAPGGARDDVRDQLSCNLQSLEDGTAVHPICLSTAQGLDKDGVKLRSQGIKYILLSDPTGPSNAE